LIDLEIASGGKLRVVHILSGDLWGGSEAQMWIQLPVLREAACDVQAIIFNEAELSTRLSERGVPVFVIPEQNGFIRLFKAALSVCRKIEPDIIVGHGYKENILGFLVCLFLKCKLVTTFHGATEYYSGFAKLKGSFYIYISRLIARRFSARIVCVSDSIARTLKFSPLEKVRIIRNVVAEMKHEVQNDDCGLYRDGRPAIALVGRLVGVKRPDLAILTLARLNENFEQLGLRQTPHLYLIGSGPLEQELKKLTERLGLETQVHFLGFKENAAAYISAADVLLISSDSEGIPTVLLEAISLKTPVVSTDVGGVPEVFEQVKSHPHRMVPAGDVAGLAEAIAGVCHSAYDSENMSAMFEASGRELSRNFLPASAVAKHLELYREIVTSTLYA